MMPCSWCGALIPPPQLESVSLCPPCSASLSNDEGQLLQQSPANYEDSLFSESFFDEEGGGFNDSSCSTRAATDDSTPSALQPLNANSAEEPCDTDTPDLYAKLQELLLDAENGTAVAIRDELWLKVHKNFYLSNCWVGPSGASSGDLERFGTSVCHYQEVMRLLSWDVPLGVVALNVSRRICLGITGVSDRHVEKATSRWTR